jgi:Cytochrome C oxidase, mono-heme subunit/FixO
VSQLAAAAQALNAPESIVQRSAEARSKATGVPVEDVLAAWAGGGAAPSGAAPSGSAQPPVTPPPAAAPQESQPAPVVTPPAAVPASEPETLTSRSVMVAEPVDPPILVGRRENPFTVMMGAAALLLLAIVIGVFVPGQPEPGNGVRTSNLAFTTEALAGRDRYLAENCAACHTQQVRPIAADAGETEKVSLSDSNQVLGARRYGPDLANVGARLDAGTIEGILEGANNHPSYASLDAAEMAGLIAYLSESK